MPFVLSVSHTNKALARHEVPLNKKVAKFALGHIIEKSPFACLIL
jgi:hypothetical protein